MCRASRVISALSVILNGVEGRKPARNSVTCQDLPLPLALTVGQVELPRGLRKLLICL